MAGSRSSRRRSGAAGEIVPLAHLFLALVDEAVPPYSLGAKEGIALINGAPLAPALAVPLLLRAEALVEHATLCGAAAIAVTGAPQRPYVVRVGELKGDPEGSSPAIHRRLVLARPIPALWPSRRRTPGAWSHLRVIPQVHGAALDVSTTCGRRLSRAARAPEAQRSWPLPWSGRRRRSNPRPLPDGQLHA